MRIKKKIEVTVEGHNFLVIPNQHYGSFEIFGSESKDCLYLIDNERDVRMQIQKKLRELE